jgi:threonine synthase
MNPTASFKDTGMTAALSVAREQGAKWVACASTGNTSASMAAYAARGNMRALVLIPDGQIAWGKLSQAMDYGAVTCQLQTDFDGCVRVLNELITRFPVALLNSVNPYRIEGQKTAAFEICEQLNYSVPVHVIVPGGNLANASALGKGFLELKQLGLTKTLPRISVIQAEGANPFYRAMHENGGESLQPVTAETRATAIRIGNPASWRKAADVLHKTGGWCEQVSEEEIAIAKSQIGTEGIGCEPASAVTLAGLKKLRADGRVSPGDTTVLILTGHTLKDPEFTIDFHQKSTQSTTQKPSKSMQKPPKKLMASADAVLRVLESEPVQ